MSASRIVIASLSLLLAGAAPAQSEPDVQPDGKPGRFFHKRIGPSVEMAAMDKLLAEELQQRTGRDAAEIAALLEKAPAPAVAEQLGVAEEDFQQALTSAHERLVQRALEAQLITAQQAEELRAAPGPGRKMRIERAP